MEAEAAREAESPPRDENNEALDYYDNVNQDTEMASSQETVPMSSQDTAPTSSQETAPMSSQESKATAPTSSQESMTQETSMPSLETATCATILNTADEAPMEDETCLEGPTLKCTPQEERALLNPLLAEFLDHLEDVPSGYLNLIVARINEIRKTRVSQTPVALPRAPPRLPPPQPISMPSEPTATLSLSEAIYSAASNLGTCFPPNSEDTHAPTRPSRDRPGRESAGEDQQSPRYNAGLFWTLDSAMKAKKIEERKPKTKDQSSIQVTASSAFKLTQVQRQLAPYHTLMLTNSVLTSFRFYCRDILMPCTWLLDCNVIFYRCYASLLVPHAKCTFYSSLQK